MTAMSGRQIAVAVINATASDDLSVVTAVSTFASEILFVPGLIIVCVLSGVLVTLWLMAGLSHFAFFRRFSVLNHLHEIPS